MTTRVAINAAGLLLLGVALAACDFSPYDIPLDPDAGMRGPPNTSKSGASDDGLDAMVSGAAPPTGNSPTGANADSNLRDNSDAMDATPPREAGTHNKQSNPETAMDSGIDATSKRSPESGPLRDADGSLDTGTAITPPSDAGVLHDAMADARTFMSDAHVFGDDEASVDELDSGDVKDPNPCTNGTYQCMSFNNFPVSGDFRALDGATISARIDGHLFETRSVNGNATLVLPLGQLLWFYDNADGYWQAESAGILNAASGLSFSIYSTLLMNSFFSAVGLQADESKGYAMALFSPNIPGASLTIDQPSDPALVVDRSDNLARIGNVLLANGDGIIHIPNVTPGPFVPTPVGPPGVSCHVTPEGLEFVAKPKTMTIFSVSCIQDSASP